MTFIISITMMTTTSWDITPVTIATTHWNCNWTVAIWMGMGCQQVEWLNSRCLGTQKVAKVHHHHNSGDLIDA